MKKIFTLMLAGIMLLGVTACGNSAGTETQTSSEPASEQDYVAAESGISDTAASEETNDENSESEASETKQTDSDVGNILVAYFSATGTTKGVAETLAEGLGADIYEITPADPYTDEDLDYNDNQSRSTLEMNDTSARPEISGSVENMDSYDIVFVGYPIWWYDAPRIMSTFVESYDFSGKTVIPFCTSGGSSIGESGSNLEALANGGTWLDGTRLQGGASWDDIKEWVDGLGISY